MSEAYFYQLTSRDRIATLRSILTNSRERGWRVAVKCCNEREAELVDAALWKAPDDGFLPHGREGNEWEADQPILIVTGASAANQPSAMVLLECFDMPSESVTGLERTSVLFDGKDAPQLDSARKLASQLAGWGVEVVCWIDRDGKWSRAESL